MKSEWKTYTVQELIDLGMLEAPMDGNHGGIHPKSSDYVDAGIPFIMANDLVQGQVDYKNCAFIAEKQANTLKKGFAKPGDVLLTHKATIGRTALVSDEYETIILTPQVTYYRIKKGISNRYLKYYFDSAPFQQLFSNWAGSGSTRAYLGITAQRKLPIVLPPFDIQKKIADCCGVIDDKIIVNNHINDNLEQQARAIFSTFIADHATSSVTVEDIVLTANTGADAIQKAPIVDYNTGVRCVRVGDMSNQRPVHEWGFTLVTPEIFKQYQLHKDDIVITRTASLGLNRLINEDLNAVYNNGLIRITINKDLVFPLIVYHQFQTEDYRNYISRINGETSVRPNMKINYLLQYSFKIPHIEDQAELLGILQPIFETQEKNIAENYTLSSLRDTLLPRLISGALDVSALDL